MMIYTSGTTGPPKGALHAHRVLLGHLPGVQMPHEFLPQPGDRLWTPADWAWAGGLLNVLLPGPAFRRAGGGAEIRQVRSGGGVPADGGAGVRNAFIPPTALRMLRAVPNPRGRFDLRLRTHRLGRRGARGRDVRLGARGVRADRSTSSTARPNATSCCPPARRSASREAGAIGKPVPGHGVAVIRADGARCEPGELGQIAVRRPDPGDVPGLLEQARTHARRSSSATG